MGKKLTEEMIRDKSNVEDISTLVDLNFWASDLEDVSILDNMPNVETVSLSLNKIVSLSYFKNWTNLKELFLRKNKIENLREINYLRNLPNLKVLWLWDNPWSSHPHYRLYIIKMLPKLQKLDNAAVSQEERVAAKKLDISSIDNEESEIADQEDDIDENKKTNDSYLKNHNIVKRDQIRKPHSGVSIMSCQKLIIWCYRLDQRGTINQNSKRRAQARVKGTTIYWRQYSLCSKSLTKVILRSYKRRLRKRSTENMAQLRIKNNKVPF